MKIIQKNWDALVVINMIRLNDRKESVKKLVKEASENTTEFIMKKLYGDNGEN